MDFAIGVNSPVLRSIVVGCNVVETTCRKLGPKSGLDVAMIDVSDAIDSHNYFAITTDGKLLEKTIDQLPRPVDTFAMKNLVIRVDAPKV